MTVIKPKTKQVELSATCGEKNAVIFAIGILFAAAITVVRDKLSKANYDYG